MREPLASATSRRALLQAAGLGLARASQGAARQVKIGIVGGGFGATFQWHLDPECEVTAVCDINPGRLDRLAQVALRNLCVVSSLG